jgi:sialic acid synthase SpsE
VAVLRPADGLSPAYLRDLVGVRLTRDLEPGAPFLPSDLAEPASGGGVDREAA